MLNPMAQGAMPGNTTHILRASLKAKLWREIEIDSRESLYDLAESITRAFGFDFDHAFGFYSKLTGNYFASPVKYELFVDMGESGGDARSVKRTTVAEAFPKLGRKMLFLFDYGDEWLFRIELVGLGKQAPKSRYPRVVASLGKAPEQYPDPDDD
jgi:hypothetical protein